MYHKIATKLVVTSPTEYPDLPVIGVAGYPARGKVVDKDTWTWEALAYDPSVGENNGDGIASVRMWVVATSVKECSSFSVLFGPSFAKRPSVPSRFSTDPFCRVPTGLPSLPVCTPPPPLFLATSPVLLCPRYIWPANVMNAPPGQYLLLIQATTTATPSQSRMVMVRHIIE